MVYLFTLSWPVMGNTSTRAGLSKFFGIPLVPGLVWSHVGKSEEIVGKSRFHSSPPKIDFYKKKFSY